MEPILEMAKDLHMRSNKMSGISVPRWHRPPPTRMKNCRV